MEFKWSVNKVTVVRSSFFTPYDQLTEAQVLAWCFAPIVTTWTDENDVEQSATHLLT